MRFHRKKKSVVPQCKKSNHWIFKTKNVANVFVLFLIKVTYLFDNGTVFFAIFMAIWGKYVLPLLNFLALVFRSCCCVSAHPHPRTNTYTMCQFNNKISFFLCLLHTFTASLGI